MKREKKYIYWGILYFLAATLLGFLNVGINLANDLADGTSTPLIHVIINELDGVYLGFLLLPFLVLFFDRYPITRKNFLKVIPLYLLVSVIYGATHTTLMYTTRTLLYDLFNLGEYSKYYGILKYRYLMEYQKQFIVFWLIYFGVMIVNVFRENQRQKLKSAELAEQLTKARLQTLQMQLNPHFLFNTLNMISSKLYENVKAADKMIANLSDLLRITLNSANKEEHPLEKEVEIAELYLAIMRARFEDRLSVTWKIEETTLEALVPGFIFQPLLENSIRYSMETLETVALEISAQRQGETLILKVADNGPGMKEVNLANHHGVGLSNTTERLSKLYGEKQQFFLNNRSSGGLEVDIHIPFHQEESP